MASVVFANEDAAASVKRKPFIVHCIFNYTLQLKQITTVLIENEYTDPTNVLLGPSIKVHLLKDDVDGALEEFQHCCKNYRCTPWKGELMKTLIMKEDATKLQWIADLSTQVNL